MPKYRLKIIGWLVVMAAFSAVAVFEAAAAQKTVTVTGVGFIAEGDIATARDHAIRDAQIRALEQAVGIEIDARTALHKTLLIDDTMMTRTQGIIKSYKILEELQEDTGLYRVTMEAAVDSTVMKEELARAAGQKKVLLVSAAKAGNGKSGDKALVRELAHAFSAAGFNLAQTGLPELEFMTLDPAAISKLAAETGHDLVASFSLESQIPQCMTHNYCAVTAGGFVRLFWAKTGEMLAAAEKENVPGFGNTKTLAVKAAEAKTAASLVDGLMARLLSPRAKEVKVVVLNISDYRSYRSFRHTLAALRWVEGVSEDTVGFHPDKSVFHVRFVQDLALLSGMLDKMGQYRFKGRTESVFTLEAKAQ